MKKNTKASILLSIYIIILNMYYKNNSDITYNNTNLPYATYNDIDIYIGNKNIINNIKTDSNDIYVIDERNLKDPNMKVCSSYKINNLKIMKIVIQVLQQYEKEHPSNWDRTSYTMLYEWICHNICFDNNIKTLRTSEVDFNNDDENVLTLTKKLFD